MPEAGDGHAPAHRVEGDPRSAGRDDADPPVGPAGSPWPAALPDLGPRTVIPYRVCQDCVDQGGRPVRESVRLSFTNEYMSWRAQRVEGTFAAYGGRALCLAHARPRLDAAGTWGREAVGADSDGAPA